MDFGDVGFEEAMRGCASKYLVHFFRAKCIYIKFNNPYRNLLLPVAVCAMQLSRQVFVSCTQLHTDSSQVPSDWMEGKRESDVSFTRCYQHLFLKKLKWYPAILYSSGVHPRGLTKPSSP